MKTTVMWVLFAVLFTLVIQIARTVKEMNGILGSLNHKVHRLKGEISIQVNKPYLTIGEPTSDGSYVVKNSMFITVDKGDDSDEIVQRIKTAVQHICPAIQENQ